MVIRGAFRAIVSRHEPAAHSAFDRRATDSNHPLPLCLRCVPALVEPTLARWSALSLASLSIVSSSI